MRKKLDGGGVKPITVALTAAQIEELGQYADYLHDQTGRFVSVSQVAREAVDFYFLFREPLDLVSQAIETLHKRLQDGQ
ncbi:MAG: hypothetical protein JRD89_02935 [Deltaproteobacteria bacterium]|nr:hypothetical protein [Deltaproteobacteria bacterium]